MSEMAKEKTDDTKEDSEAVVIMPQAQEGQNGPSYCIKTVQETSASLLRMWLICFAYLLPNLACGLAMTFSVTGLPHYQNQDDPTTSIVLDEDQGSWFVSVITICMMIGTILGGFLTEKIGCLWSLRVSLMMELIGWVTIYMAKDFFQLMTGRILTGFGSGLSTPSAYLILTDLSLIRFRGIMATLNSFSNNFAWLIGLVLGKYCSLYVLILYYSLSTVLFLIICPFLPESPLWLTKQGLEDKATQALRLLRGPDYPVQVEAKELLVCVQNSSDGDDSSRRFAKKMKYYLTTREFLAPMGILFTLSIVQGSCGVDTISYYSLKIFQMAKIPLDEYLMSILLQIGYTAGYLMISPLMEKINRKHLFITASSLMALALSVLASNMPNIDDEDNLKAPNGGDTTPLYIQMILPVAVVMFSFCYGAGFGPAVYTWSSELFPPRGRNLGCSLSLSTRYIVAAVILKIYPWMFQAMGLSHLFSLHALVLVIGICFVFFVVPETRGLTLTQLATLFGGQVGKSSDTSSESTLMTGTSEKV